MLQHWQWKQVCETKQWSSESLESVFLHVALVLLYSKKIFLALTEHFDTPSMHDCLNWWEDPSNNSVDFADNSFAE